MDPVIEILKKYIYSSNKIHIIYIINMCTMHDKTQQSSSMSILSHHVSNNWMMQELHAFTTTHVLSDPHMFYQIINHITHACIKQTAHILNSCPLRLVNCWFSWSLKEWRRFDQNQDVVGRSWRLGSLRTEWFLRLWRLYFVRSEWGRCKICEASREKHKMLHKVTSLIAPIAIFKHFSLTLPVVSCFVNFPPKSLCNDRFFLPGICIDAFGFQIKTNFRPLPSANDQENKKSKP